MVRVVDIRVSTRLALAAAVFTVAKENTFRFLACYVHNVVCRPHLSQEPVWAEPLGRGLQKEDLCEPAWRVASTEEAEGLGASFVRPRFAEMLRVMCVDVHACYQCISMSL